MKQIIVNISFFCFFSVSSFALNESQKQAWAGDYTFQSFEGAGDAYCPLAIRVSADKESLTLSSNILDQISDFWEFRSINVDKRENKFNRNITKKSNQVHLQQQSSSKLNLIVAGFRPIFNTVRYVVFKKNTLTIVQKEGRYFRCMYRKDER